MILDLKSYAEGHWVAGTGAPVPIASAVTGDIIAVSPPLIAEKAQIDQIAGTIAAVLKTLA